MKTIVITGSTKGIGKGLAENFLKRGHKVVISSRKQAGVNQTVQAFAQQFGSDKVTGLACDVTQPNDLSALWQHAKDHFGKVDVWVNNAGMSLKRRHLAEQSDSELAAIVATNFSSILFANKMLVANMLRQGSGQIWNMEGFGSNGATQPGMAAYGATKYALTYLTKSLQKEVKGTPVQVNTLSPGIVVTDLLIGDYDLDSPEWLKARKIFNILGDTVETVTPWLVDGVLKANKSGAKVAWLTGGKAFVRFLTAGFNKRDLFSHLSSDNAQSTSPSH